MTLSEDRFRLFENDITINGSHATKLKFLAKKNSRDDSDPNSQASAKIFKRYVDVYMNAAVFGIYYQQKSKVDTSSTDDARIFTETLIKERKNCMFLYRLVMLLDRTDENLTTTERIDRAFRYDSIPDKNDELKKNWELFQEYVLGGIDKMYEKFTTDCSKREDYLEKSFEFMRDFKSELEVKDYSAEISKLLNS